MKREKSWKEFTIDSMRFDYGLHAELFADEHDDRRLFTNMYNQIMEAVECLPDNPPAFVCVAMNHKIDESRGTMDAILDRYVHGRWGEPAKIGLRQKMERWPGILSRIVAC